MNILLDTNILVDVLAHRVPFCFPAVEVWNLVELRKVRGFISAISFNNVFYRVRKMGGRNQPVKSLLNLRNSFETVPLDVAVLNQAIASPLHDFEDAIHYFSARSCGAGYLVTRNGDHFPKDGPEIVSAQEFLDLPEIRKIQAELR